MITLPAYCHDPFTYQRRKTRVVSIGDVPLGGDHPIRVQSMTISDTMDTEATVAETIQLVEAGCEIVRITAPSLNEAENLRHIKAALHKRGIRVPLVADIHFTPNAALKAAEYVEKVASIRAITPTKNASPSTNTARANIRPSSNASTSASNPWC